MGRELTPRLTDTQYALWLVMDGMQKRDVMADTGHDEETCDFIWAEYEFIKSCLDNGYLPPAEFED